MIHLLLPVGSLGTLLASIQRLVSQYGTSPGMAAVLQRQLVFISSAVRAESEYVLASKVQVDLFMTCIILEPGVEVVLFRFHRLCSS